MKKEYEQLAENELLGDFQYDEDCEVMHGVYNGYNVEIDENFTYAYYTKNIYRITMSVSKDGSNLVKGEFEPLVKSSKQISNAAHSEHRVTFTVRIRSKNDAMYGEIQEILQIITDYMATNGYENCCQFCGGKSGVGNYIYRGNPTISCDTCYDNLMEDTGNVDNVEKIKKENLPLGLLGSLLGIIAGVAFMIIFWKGAYISFIGGLAMAVCAFYGYEFLGGRITRKGILICCAMMVLAIYIGNKICFSLLIMEYYKESFGTSFSIIPDLIDTGYLTKGFYFGEMAKTYGCAILGTIAMIPGILTPIRRINISKKLDRYYIS